MSVDWQIGFRVKGLISPIEGSVYNDYILIKGISPIDDSYVFFKVKLDENEDKDHVREKLVNSLRNITQIYSLITNHYTEVLRSSVTARISVENPFGNTKYPPDTLGEFIAVPTDEQRNENTALLNKTFEKYKIVEKIGRMRKKQFLMNAIDYYNRALGDIRQEEKLIDFMICLESLFSDEQGELRLRYSLRLSRFLGAKQESETSKIFRRTYDLYQKRSKVVHGTESIKLDDGEIWALQVNLRDVIKCFLHIDLSKKKILEMLDESVYDDDRKRELKKVVLEASGKW